MKLTKYVLGAILLSAPFIHSQKLEYIKEIETDPLTSEETKDINNLLELKQKQDDVINTARLGIQVKYLTTLYEYEEGTKKVTDHRLKSGWSENWYFQDDYKVLMNETTSNLCGYKPTVFVTSISDEDSSKVKKLYEEEQKTVDKIREIETRAINRVSRSAEAGYTSIGIFTGYNSVQSYGSWDLTLSKDHKSVFFSYTPPETRNPNSLCISY